MHCLTCLVCAAHILYMSRFKAKSQRQPGAKVHLASLLSLHPHHFPEELFSDRDRR